MNKVPFNKPFIIGDELRYIREAVQRGQLAADGYFTDCCEKWLQDTFGARRVLLTHSCTAALEISALLCDTDAESEVIMPSYTFTSTANAFALRGGRIRFIDIRPDTLNMDVNLLEEMLSPRTRAVVPVHYAGVACDMDAILSLTRPRGIRVVEDAAQGVYASYKNRWLGTIGDVGAYSFHETKNFISGEGGALIINDESLIERAEIIRQKGTNRAKFLRGEVDKYTWVDLGSSYPPSELISAFLFAQLESASAIAKRRLAIHSFYQSGLLDLEQAGHLKLPTIPADCTHNAHMFYLITNDAPTRGRLLTYLKEHQIGAIFHYVPLHMSPMGLQMGYKPGDFPVTEALSERIVRLPLFHNLELADQISIIDLIHDFYRTV